MTTKKNAPVRHISIDNMIGKILAHTDNTETSNSSCPTLEDLAAFIDGKISGHKRELIQIHLNNCEDCYAIFLETAKTIDELDSGEQTFSGKRWYGIPSAIAVAVVLMIAIGIFFKKPEIADMIYPGQTAQLNNFILSLDQNLIIDKNKEITTSYGLQKTFSQESFLFRTGVSSFELKVALLHKQVEEASRLLVMINGYFNELSGAGLVEQAHLPSLPKGTDDYPLYSRQVDKTLSEAFSDSNQHIYYQFGQWTMLGMYSAMANSPEYLNYQNLHAAIKLQLMADAAPDGLISSIDSIEITLKKSSLTTQDFKQLARKYEKILAFF